MFGRLKKLIYAFVFYSGLGALLGRLFDAHMGARVRILYGHNLRADDMEANGVFEALGFMSVDEFDRKVDYLKRNFTVLSMDAALDAVKTGNIPKRAVALTFDDGYRDKLMRIFPILEKYRVPATMYLSSGFMNEKNFFWFNRLIECVCRATTISDQEKAEMIDDTARQLKSMPDELKHKTLDDLEKRLSYKPADHARLLPMLSWDEVKTLAASPLITIGAHTVTHPILTQMPLDRACAEITDGRNEIAANAGVTPRHFAYPNGRFKDFNRDLRNYVESRGFVSAVSTEPGGNAKAHDPFVLRREGFDHEPFYMFGLKVLGFFDFARSMKTLFVESFLSAVLMRRMRPAGRSVYFTFDDGPHPQRTGPILDALKKQDVKVTFFASGSEIAKYPDVARRIVAEGHELASHGWAHERWSHFDFSGLLGDIRRAEAAIESVGGRKNPLYRPPYGRLTFALLVIALFRRMKIVLWSLDSDDDRSQSQNVVLTKCGEAKAGDIVLFHDDCAATEQALPSLIDDIRKRGLHFARV